MVNKCIKEEKLGWSKSVVMICSKCGHEAERIKSDLKSYCKERKGQDVRVINTGCLNICPEDRIAVVVASNNEKEVFRAYSVPKNAYASDVYDEILS